MLDKTLDGKSAALARVSPRLAKYEHAEYSVVGVSHQQNNFEELKHVLAKSEGEEVTVEVVLRHEPENVNSLSRSAIAVYSSGYHLGHIPEAAAPIFSDLLRKSSGLARATARLYFGSTGRNSLRLKIEWPPRFEHEEAKNFELFWLKGDGKFGFPMRTKKYPIYWELLATGKKHVPELEVGEIFEGDDGLLTVGEFGRSPYFSCKYGHIAKPKLSDEYLVNKNVSALGGQVRVKYQLIRTGPSSHKLSLDWTVKSNSKSVPSTDSAHGLEPRPIAAYSDKPRRWPGEEDYDSLLISARESRKRKEKYSFGGGSEAFQKVFKVIGKVLLYLTFGLFIIAFMVATGVFKDTLKQNGKK